jgi:hypothetical protein
MHYFLYPTKDTFITNYPPYMYKNMGLDELIEVEKRVSGYSCSSTTTIPVVVYYTSSSLELLDGPFSSSFDSGSVDPRPVSSAIMDVSGPTTMGAVLSRALLHFDLTTISQSISSGQISDPQFYLNLKVCESQEVPVRYSLAAYPVSQSWAMGTGYKYDGYSISDGANWKFNTADQLQKWWDTGSLLDCTGGGVWWINSGSKASGSGYAEYANISKYNEFPNCEYCDYEVPSSASLSGSFPTYACYQYFNYQTSDVRMNVTPIVNAWINGEIVNEGFIIMHSDESSSVDYGTLKFFSKETNTIYSPYLDVCWHDAIINTSGSDAIILRDAVVNMKNMAQEYKFGSIVRMDVSARKRYPIKTFTNKVSDYLSPYYLPSSSFYQIKDAESEETILPYDDYTRLSYDSYGNYFMLDTSGLPSERYYKVEIRSEQSGSINTFTIPTAFKISR